MLDPSIHLALQNTFGRRPPDSQPPRCLNTRHKDAACHLCLDACPVDAIALSGSASITPTIDPQTCIHCGICLTACPTDVFSQPLAPETSLLRTHRQVPSAQSLTLICPLHPLPQHNQAPPTEVIRHQRCLAAFSTFQLLELSVDGQRQLWLDDSYCADCPIGSAHASLLRSLQAGRHLLAAFARPAALHSHTLDADHLASASHPVQLSEATQPAYTRRGLFKAVGQIVQQRTTEIVENLPPPVPTGPVPVAERLPARVPASRQHFNQQVQRLAAASAASAALLPTAIVPYGNLTIADDRCCACELCARFCPSSALRFVSSTKTDDGPTHFVLEFAPTLCLDCNICTATCPEDAITMLDTVPAEALQHPTASPLVSGELTPCQQCGTLTRIQPHADAPLCYICRRTIAKPDLLSDLFRKLDATS